MRWCVLLAALAGLVMAVAQTNPNFLVAALLRPGCYSSQDTTISLPGTMGGTGTTIGSGYTIGIGNVVTDTTIVKSFTFFVETNHPGTPPGNVTAGVLQVFPFTARNYTANLLQEVDVTDLMPPNSTISGYIPVTATFTNPVTLVPSNIYILGFFIPMSTPVGSVNYAFALSSVPNITYNYAKCGNYCDFFYDPYGDLAAVDGWEIINGTALLMNATLGCSPASPTPSPTPSPSAHKGGATQVANWLSILGATLQSTFSPLLRQERVRKLFPKNLLSLT